MGKTLYLECGSGISGDMTVAALLDLGADQKELLRALESLPAEGFTVEISRVKKSGLDACDFHVKLDEAHENHDHDMEYLHGHLHGHMHKEGCSGHSHIHRGLGEILEIIRQGDLTERAREIAIRIFTILAEAESKAHGVPIEEVHFHEVGAVDSIVDIVAAAVCFDNLGITDVIIPKISEGTGFVRCQHGVIPVPVPAVVNIVQASGLKLAITGTEGELVTPTGAAIAACVCTSDKLPGEFVIEKTGIGAGKRTYDRPSILRAMLIQGTDRPEAASFSSGRDVIYRLETNVDDCSGEALGYVMDRLLREGARDVHYIPVFMKKNRPAYQLNVICSEEQLSKMEQMIFEETTTIGIRRIRMERTILPREMKTCSTSLGEAKVKECILPDGTRRRYPEYDSAAELAGKNGIAMMEAYRRIQRECEEYGNKSSI